MAFVAIDENGSEYIYDRIPKRSKTENVWVNYHAGDYIELPKGSIKKLIGRELNWSDEPVEIKENEDEK